MATKKKAAEKKSAKPRTKKAAGKLSAAHKAAEEDNNDVEGEHRGATIHSEDGETVPGAINEVEE